MSNGLGVSGRETGCEGFGAGEPSMAFVLETSIESNGLLRGLLRLINEALAGSAGLRNGLVRRST